MTVHEKIRKIVTNPILYIQNFMKVVNKNGKIHFESTAEISVKKS